MKQEIMYLFTRTPLHVGAGNSVGVVDSPIMRERHTRTPIIPGSSIKGVLRDLWDGDNNQKEIFGDGNCSGRLVVGEARVLAFPVRSAFGGFAWITSPHALKKWAADTGTDLGVVREPENEKCYVAGTKVVLNGNVVLEEYRFAKSGDISGEILNQFEKFSDSAVWKTVKERLVIVSDEIFSYFVENACEVVTRIKIDDETGVVKNGALFNQEQCPSETMFYAVLNELPKKKNDEIDECIAAVCKKVSAGTTIQIGGDATIGLGFCSVIIK